MISMKVERLRIRDLEKTGNKKVEKTEICENAPCCAINI